MTKITVKCDWAECDFTLGEINKDAASLPALVQLLQVHVTAKHQKGESIPGVGSGKSERAEKPKTFAEMSEEDWKYFLSRWNCQCGQNVEHAKQVIKEQLITRMVPQIIQKDALPSNVVDTLQLEKPPSLTERKEAGQVCQDSPVGEQVTTEENIKPESAKCKFCGDFHIWGRVFCKASDHTCTKCEKEGHFEAICRSKKKKKKERKNDGGAVAPVDSAKEQSSGSRADDTTDDKSSNRHPSNSDPLSILKYSLDFIVDQFRKRRSKKSLCNEHTYEEFDNDAMTHVAMTVMVANAIFSTHVEGESPPTQSWAKMAAGGEASVKLAHHVYSEDSGWIKQGSKKRHPRRS